MKIRTFNTYATAHENLYKEMLTLTQSINATYPDYTHWFKEKFLSGLDKKERMYIIAQNEKDKLLGCLLIKKTDTEKKISTLFVKPEHRGKGIGKKLLAQAIKELGKHPSLTVSSRNISQLYPLLKSFGFHLSAVKKGVYHPEDTEYYFNDPKADMVKNNLLPILIGRIRQQEKV